MIEILIEDHHILLSSIKESPNLNTALQIILSKNFSWKKMTHHHSSNTDKARSHSLGILLKFFYPIHFNGREGRRLKWLSHNFQYFFLFWLEIVLTWFTGEFLIIILLKGDFTHLCVNQMVWNGFAKSSDIILFSLFKSPNVSSKTYPRYIRLTTTLNCLSQTLSVQFFFSHTLSSY